MAERADVIIDFAPFAGKTLYLENRLKQTDGRGPIDHTILAAGQGNLVLKIIVDGHEAEGSKDPATITKFYDLPSTNVTPRVKRTFEFDNESGGWTINEKFFDCNEVPFTVQENSVEQWTLINDEDEWEHPIHIHLEEFQTLSINGRPPATSPLSRPAARTCRCWKGMAGRRSSSASATFTESTRCIATTRSTRITQ